MPVSSWGQSMIWAASGYTVLFAVSCGLVLKRRNLQPLKFRGPRLVLLSGLGAFAGAIWLFIYLIDLHTQRGIISHKAFCQMGAWINWVGYPLFVLPYLLRAYRLAKIFNTKHVERLTEDPRHWRKLVITENFLLKVLFGIMFLVVGAKVTAGVLSLHLDDVGFGCDSDKMVVWLPMHAVEILLLLFVVYRLRAFRDDYGVAQEYSAVCFVWATSAALQFVMESFNDESSVHHWFHSATMSQERFLDMFATIVLVRNILIFGISIVWPLYSTYADPVVLLWSNCDALRSLETLLRDIICIHYFRMYLSSQGHVEYILCWQEIELFADLQDPEQIQEQGMRIYEKYFKKEAELEINIRLDTKARITADISQGHLTADLFREAQSEVFASLYHWFNPGFLASDSCRACLKELEREEHLRKVLQHSNML